MSEEFKIYTKGGDKGETSLLGGTRVAKSHERVEAYGNIDELNSFIGLIRDQDIDAHYRDVLIRIQENLFVAEALIARDPETQTRDLPSLSEDDIFMLEKEIDTMNEHLPLLTNFILPGGHPIVSYCHIARAVCRRAERSLIRLNHVSPVENIIIQLLTGATETSWIVKK